MITRGQIKKSADIKLGNGRVGGVSIDDTLANDALNTLENVIYKEIIARDYQTYIEEEDFYAYGNTAQDIPKISSIEGKDLGFWIISNGRKSEKIEKTGEGSKKEGFYVKGNKLYFTGFSTSKLVRLYYIPILERKKTWNFNDEFISLDHIENEIKNIAIRWLKYTYYEDEEIGDKATGELIKYEEELENLKNNICIESDIFDLPNISSAY